MTWIRIDTDLPRHELLGTVADLLKVETGYALGLLVACWTGFADHQPDGNAGAVTDRTLEEWALWRGRRGRFAPVFRQLCVGEDGLVRGWWRQESLLRHQERKRRRPNQQTRGSNKRGSGPARNRQKSGAASGSNPAPDSRPISAGNSNEKGSPVGSDLRSSPPSDPPAAANASGALTASENWVSRCVDLHRQHAGEPRPGQLGKVLKPVFEALGLDQLLVAFEGWLKASRARFGPEDFARTYREYLPIAPYLSDGSPNPAFLEAAGIRP